MFPARIVATVHGPALVPKATPSHVATPSALTVSPGATASKS
jgi:hypothetical protein